MALALFGNYIFNLIIKIVTSHPLSGSNLLLWNIKICLVLQPYIGSEDNKIQLNLLMIPGEWIHKLIC